MNTNLSYLNKITAEVLDASIVVHKELGPGLLESVYEACLYKELCDRNVFVEQQVALPVIYKGEDMGLNFRMDLLVENEVVVELKSVEILMPIHSAQILTYLKLADKKLGLLINFNESLLIDGYRRFIN